MKMLRALPLLLWASVAFAQAKIPIRYILTTSSDDFSMNGGKITGLAAPTLSTDAVNKSYADSLTCLTCVQNTLTLTAGNGLTGGGSLSANLTFTVLGSDNTVSIGPSGIAVAVANLTGIAQSAITGLASTLAGKQPLGNYITALMGDGTASGPSGGGSATLTLATVNANVGSFTNANVTVNAKGLVTAASGGTPGVTSVTGSSPIVSSGGTTPAISLNQSALQAASASQQGVVTTGTQTFAGAKTFSTAVAATFYSPPTTPAAYAIDWSTSNVFYKALTATTNTFTFLNSTSGQIINVAIYASGSYTETWPTVKWVGGSAPVQTTGSTDVYTFMNIAGTYYGSVVQGLQ